ncbi:MAG: hypothetical protein PHE95_04005 [Candidatus Methanomethylophilus sp.]|nr:hypothetical protein [Methanomethylophilus sp.]
MADSLFRFCCRFIVPCSPPITENKKDLILNRIRTLFPNHLGSAFGKICRDCVRLILGMTHGVLGREPDRKTQTTEEIDLAVIRSNGGSDTLCGNADTAARQQRRKRPPTRSERLNWCQKHRNDTNCSPVPDSKAIRKPNASTSRTFR